MDHENGSAAALLEFIDRSPSPWHAGANILARLREAGFQLLDEGAHWQLRPGADYVVSRGGSSVIAFRLGQGDPTEAGIRVVGAHTDSPGFRVKPSGSTNRGGMASVGVEIYGGPIIASFADRELTLAGRVMVEMDDGLEERLLHFSRPMLRLPNLAIHMNRTVNDEGLKFVPPDELRFMLEGCELDTVDQGRLRAMIADHLDTPAESIQSWDLAVADTQQGRFFGPDLEFIANGQLDNLASCDAAIHALLAARPSRGVSMIACFDHEEVGSESYKGAAGSFLQDVISRVTANAGSPQAMPRTCANSWLVSADMAHAYHPGFAGYYDEENAARLNGGPVIKINAKQRYTTDAPAEAYFASLCDRAGVPCQRYVHRANLPCGSTIGPMAAARLGMRTVDVGNPMWSMHSARESAGALDHGYMIRALTEFFAEV
jgi:aspartyl aminopeptidase